MAAIAASPVDLAKVAEAFGVKSFHVERPDEVPATCDAALAHPSPALIEAVIGPDERLMPGKKKPEIAEKVGQALRRGQPNAHPIGLKLFRDAQEDPDANRRTIPEALEKTAPDVLPGRGS